MTFQVVLFSHIESSRVHLGIGVVISAGHFAGISATLSFGMCPGQVWRKKAGQGICQHEIARCQLCFQLKIQCSNSMHSLKLREQLKIHGWKMKSPFWVCPIFRGYVSFMEGKGFNPRKWFFEIVLLIFFTHGFCGNDPIWWYFSDGSKPPTSNMFALGQISHVPYHAEIIYFSKGVAQPPPRLVQRWLVRKGKKTKSQCLQDDSKMGPEPIVLNADDEPL